MIKFSPSSILGFVLAVSLLAYLAGRGTGNQALASAALPILIVSVIVWLIYIILGVRGRF